MNDLLRTARRFTLGLLGLSLVLGAAASYAETDNSQARKDKILANLELKFPQLSDINPTLGDLKASGYEGLDEGSFSFKGQRGEQSQTFLVSTDDTKLYMVNGDPLDVSRSADDIKVELAKREEEKMKEAAERSERLAASIEGLPFRGAADAPVTIIEFSDFQCPYCSRGAKTMEEVLEKYEGKVKLVFKHFPLGFHPWAKPAAIASHCAGQQDGDAFWTLHDKYFEDQKTLTPENVIAKSKEYASATGIDMDKWADCADNKESEAYKAASALVDADMAFGSEMGVSGTPGFFVNGEFLNGAQPLTAFEPIIEKATAGS